MSNLDIKWVPESGSPISFTTVPYSLLRNIMGLGLPTFDYVTHQYPDHEDVVRVTPRPRDLMFDILIQKSDRSELFTGLRTLYTSVLPNEDAIGTIEITRPDGTIRQLQKCILKGSLEGSTPSETFGQNWASMQLFFRAYDPYFYETTAVVHQFTQSAPVTFFPILPMLLSQSGVFGNTTITNAGSAEAWPVWEVTGPGDTIHLENMTTGKSVDVSITLSAGEVLRIDTRPGYKTITLGSTNEFQYLDPGSEFWSLIPGSNSLNITMASVTSASNIKLNYTRRHVAL